MTKKSRRSRAKVRATQQASGSKVVNRSETISAGTATTANVESGITKSTAYASTVTQEARHQHIASELQRIGIIAGILFVIIIVLGFVIK